MENQLTRKVCCPVQLKILNYRSLVHGSKLMVMPMPQKMTVPALQVLRRLPPGFRLPKVILFFQVWYVSNVTVLFHVVI